MATGGPPSPQPGHPVTSRTDCPMCGSLCLGPAILPCRDVICRRCLHGMLQERGLRLACQQCGQQLDLPRDRKVTVTNLVQQMGTDPVLERLVFQELNKATDVRCLHCPNKQADNVCLDCQEYYCDVCSGIHCRGGFTSDHVLHQLSQALQNSPAAARATPTSSLGSSSAIPTSSLDSICNLPDPQSGPDSPDLTSTAPVRSPTSSSTHTPTSAQLPPATPTTTHAFTPTTDVMTITSQRLFTMSPTADDREKPWIIAIMCLPNDTLLMVDRNNKKVKVMGLAPPHTVSASLTVSETPRRLALLSDGLVAMTTYSPLIYLIKVTDTLTVTSQIKTVREYIGVAGQTDGRLLVSCVKDEAGPAAVQVLTRQGHVVRSVTDSTRLTELETPRYICNDGDNHVLVSDWETHRVHKVEVSSGHVTHTYDHTDLMYPAQVCADRAGVIYVASGGGGCVLMRNRGGQWRQLLTFDLSNQEYVSPRGLCLTRTGRLVVTWDNSHSGSVVGIYDLV